MQSLFLLPKSWPKRPSGDARTAQANAIHSLKRDIQSIRARETPACFHQTVGFLQIIHKTIAGRHDMKQLPCTAQLHCLLVTKWSPSSSLRVRRTMERGGRRKQKKTVQEHYLVILPHREPHKSRSCDILYNYHAHDHLQRPTCRQSGYNRYKSVSSSVYRSSSSSPTSEAQVEICVGT